MRNALLAFACVALLPSVCFAQHKILPPERPIAQDTQSSCDSIGTNLLLNCGFESGDFSGWNLYGDTQLGLARVGDFAAHSGSYGAFFGVFGNNIYLEQAINTDPTQTYHLEFWLAEVEGGYGSYFEVQWNGQTLCYVTDPDQFDWRLYVFDSLPTDNAVSVLTFVFGWDMWAFDDVIVQPNDPAPLLSTAAVY